MYFQKISVDPKIEESSRTIGLQSTINPNMRSSISLRGTDDLSSIRSNLRSDGLESISSNPLLDVTNEESPAVIAAPLANAGPSGLSDCMDISGELEIAGSTKASNNNAGASTNASEKSMSLSSKSAMADTGKNDESNGGSGYPVHSFNLTWESSEPNPLDTHTRNILEEILRNIESEEGEANQIQFLSRD